MGHKVHVALDSYAGVLAGLAASAAGGSDIQLFFSPSVAPLRASGVHGLHPVFHLLVPPPNIDRQRRFTTIAGPGSVTEAREWIRMDRQFQALVKEIQGLADGSPAPHAPEVTVWADATTAEGGAWYELYTRLREDWPGGTAFSIVLILSPEQEALCGSCERDRQAETLRLFEEISRSDDRPQLLLTQRKDPDQNRAFATAMGRQRLMSAIVALMHEQAGLVGERAHAIELVPYLLCRDAANNISSRIIQRGRRSRDRRATRTGRPRKKPARCPTSTPSASWKSVPKSSRRQRRHSWSRSPNFSRNRGISPQRACSSRVLRVSLANELRSARMLFSRLAHCSKGSARLHAHPVTRARDPFAVGCSSRSRTS